MKQTFSDLISSLGHDLSSLVADAAAHPLSQAGVVVFCFAWWASGLPTDILTSTLSIAAITLTQMVLNRQKLREEDDRRRDVAMHAKLDELLRAEQFARKELAEMKIWRQKKLPRSSFASRGREALNMPCDRPE